MTGVCKSCGQDLPRPEPVPCPAQLRGQVCRACGHQGMAHTPDGVCMTCIVESPRSQRAKETAS